MTNAQPRRSWWEDRPIAVKVLAGTGVSAAVALVIGLAGLQSLSTTAEISEDLSREGIAGVTQVADATAALSDIRIQIRNAILAPEGQDTVDAGEALTSAEASFADAMTVYAAGELTAEQADLVDQVTAAMGTYEDFISTTLQPLADADDVEGWYAATTGSSYGAQLNELMTQLRQTELDAAAGQAAEARSMYESQRTLAILLMVVGTGLAVGTGYLAARRLARQVGKVQAVAEGLAAGDLTVTSGVSSADEVGRMAVALDSAVVDLRVVMSSVVSSSEAVSVASERLSSTSAEISAAAEETAAQSGVVSTAAEEVSRSVATVAAGAEEMGASIREIAQNANEAARVASQAVGVAASANATVSKLGASSAEIGDVVKAITSIAEQTNLLALNATIEAARAGEAGKGFAVVANEVKELAQETARATDDIGRRVATIQADTTGAVAAIDEISAIIASINDYQTTIASAVEEQTATTQEMSRSVAGAADGSERIVGSISGVSAATLGTTEALSQSRTAIDELSSMASDLNSAVARFTL